MITFTLQPIAFVRDARARPIDDHWRGASAVIELADHVDADAILQLDAFSHLEVVFLFDRVSEDRLCHGARHPRNRQDWPLVGIFAQRGKRRPNRLGVSRCRLSHVEGRRIHVLDLDAIEGTPVLDIKPWMDEFAPLGPTHQPDWSRALMDRYYLPDDEAPDQD